MRFLSHLFAALLAVVALAPTLDAAPTPTRAAVTHQANIAGNLADAQPRALDEDDPRWVAPGTHGDDNADGYLDEGEAGWICWAFGNKQCASAPLQGR